MYIKNKQKAIINKTETTSEVLPPNFNFLT